jgi:FkbM family methyltransferase
MSGAPLGSPDAVRWRAEIDGIRIGGPRIEHVAHVEAWRRGHERAMARHMARAVRPGMTVVDAGAYLGYFTLLAADRVGPKGRVYAFEPHPESVQALCENVRANGFEDRVTVVPMALDDGRAIRRLRLEDNPAQSRLGRHETWKRSATVRCTTLDLYLAAEAAPDLVKVDVEGAEVAVLAGMASTLERVDEGFAMIMEFNPAALRTAGTGPEELVARGERGGVADPRHQRT